MGIIDLQTQVLLHGLKVLYYSLGGSNKELFEEDIKLEQPLWYNIIVAKVCGYDFFNMDQVIDQVNDIGQIRSIFTEICLPPGKTCKPFYQKQQPLALNCFSSNEPNESWQVSAVKEIELNIEHIKKNPDLVLLVL